MKVKRKLPPPGAHRLLDTIIGIKRDCDDLLRGRAEPDQYDMAESFSLACGRAIACWKAGRRK